MTTPDIDSLMTQLLSEVSDSSRSKAPRPKSPIEQARQDQKRARDEADARRLNDAKERERQLSTAAGVLPPEAVVKLFSEQWHDEAIILIRREQHCRGCGSVHISSSDHIFIRRFHPHHKVHEEAISLRQWSPLWSSLPKRIEVHTLSIGACHECFHAAIEGAISQPDLPLWLPEAPETPEALEHSNNNSEALEHFNDN